MSDDLKELVCFIASLISFGFALPIAMQPLNSGQAAALVLILLAFGAGMGVVMSKGSS